MCSIDQKAEVSRRAVDNGSEAANHKTWFLPALRFGKLVRNNPAHGDANMHFEIWRRGQFSKAQSGKTGQTPRLWIPKGHWVRGFEFEGIESERALSPRALSSRLWMPKGLWIPRLSVREKLWFWDVRPLRSVFKISKLFLRPRPWQFEIRDSTDKQATCLFSGFETLNLKFAIWNYESWPYSEVVRLEFMRIDCNSEPPRTPPAPTPDHFETNDQNMCSEATCASVTLVSTLSYFCGTGGGGVHRGSQ